MRKRPSLSVRAQRTSLDVTLVTTTVMPADSSCASRHASSSSWLRTPSLTWRRTVRWPAVQREPMLSIRSPSGRAGRSLAGTENTTGPMSCAVTDSTTPYERNATSIARPPPPDIGADAIMCGSIPPWMSLMIPPSDSPVAK